MLFRMRLFLFKSDTGKYPKTIFSFFHQKSHTFSVKGQKKINESFLKKFEMGEFAHLLALSIAPTLDL